MPRMEFRTVAIATIAMTLLLLQGSRSQTLGNRQRAVRADLVFVVNVTATGELFTVAPQSPACSEVYSLMEPVPTGLSINPTSGMVSMTGNFNSSLTNVSFTVNITCANNPTCK